MPFNSFNFWVIFPFIFISFWIIPQKFVRARNLLLLTVSYLLYMNWKPAFAIVLLGVTAVTYIGAILLEQHPNNKQIICSSFATLGLLALLIFKYYNFINSSLTDVLTLIGLNFSLPGLNWAIPVGISFFTFQAVGYLFDVYHKRFKPEHNFLDYALFVSFFPQVTSGPISRADELLPQLKNPHTFTYEQGRDGLKMLLWGMFMKLVIADRIGIYVDTVCSNYIHYSGSILLFASIMYSIQIYCDFAGYSLMAIGISKTLGIDLIDNFRRPYFAASVTEFWKRWHISLTRWLTTHVYIAMGGNRCSKLRQYINIMATFLVSGIWHGANWTFIIWGAIHGAFQIIEKALMGEHLKKELSGEKRLPLRLVRILITFIIVTFAWIIFRMPNIHSAFDYISKIFTDFGTFSIDPLDIVSILTLGISLTLLLGKSLNDEFFKLPILATKWAKWSFYIIIAVLILSIGVLDCGQFIYVNF